MNTGGVTLAKKKDTAIDVLPMLKTVEQMSRISGIGENKLRELMDSGELEYIKNGNRRLIADTAIWDWYERAKIAALIDCEGA
jgi:excisionase family DNA binding protein